MNTQRTRRPAVDEHPPYYAQYIEKVPAGDVVALLGQQIERTRNLLAPLTDAQARFRYAEGKWSPKEIIGHLADAERVFSYRLLTFARGDAGPLPGFDENAYVPASEIDRLPLGQVVDELARVRAATIALLEGLPDAAWGRVGTANGKPITVRALAWIIAGHEIHHARVLAERYIGAS
jgi:hypothetical protein